MLRADYTSMAQDTVRTLDVRAIDGEPFSTIVSALDALGPDETLRLVSDFEPVPLYDVLDAKGFTHETRQVATDKWHVDVTTA